jgi:hypothetical protein|tara:strand:- start:183 stop:371 length:189 start_codon:yes stop_codon:yes gene_type:complete
MEKLKNLVKSRRFWVAIAGVVIAVSDALGLGLSPEMVTNLVVVGASWIVGESLRSSDSITTD